MIFKSTCYPSSILTKPVILDRCGYHPNDLDQLIHWIILIHRAVAWVIQGADKLSQIGVELFHIEVLWRDVSGLRERKREIESDRERREGEKE